jgi:ribosomal protein S12 methylthiotransferase
MQQAGFEFRMEIDGCDTVILNTCGFIHSARDEARDYIHSLVELKKQGRIQRIIVRGCMPKFEGIEKLVMEFPDVDEWFGIPNLVKPEEISFKKRRILTEKHVAYLRIADGCDRRCTFCAIPNIRGAFRSEPLESILDDARRLAENGVKELVIVAQETTFWGTDLYGKPHLAELLRELEKIELIRWIRMMYSYPKFFDDDLIELFADGGSGKGKLLPYIDIPLQHANDEILRLMNRHVTKKETEKLLKKLRDRIPNLVFRTSLIVGFPGETDLMFEELLKFVETWKFERAGVFPFSAERGTPAAALGNRVPEQIIERRLECLYKVCERHSTAWATRQKGQILQVQIDGNYVDQSGRNEPNLFIGRTFADAPDIDPVVYVTAEQLKTGSLIPCEILENDGCNLIGVEI